MNELRVVAEEIEYFRSAWWLTPAELLGEATLRRGSASLHLLLSQGLAGRAWRAVGLSGEPSILAPDLETLAVAFSKNLSLTVAAIAGGGRIKGVDIAFLGAHRIDNPSTGVPANADEGFAVEVSFVSRDARGTTTPSSLDPMLERPWPVSQYLASPGAVRRGQVVSRGQWIDYFRNELGGAHVDEPGSTPKKEPVQELLRELQDKLRADITTGPHFELLSMGQAIGRSPDFERLLALLPTIPPWSR